MKQWRLVAISGAVVLIAGLAVLLFLKLRERQASSELTAARNAARQAGLPVNAEEFRKLLGEPQGKNAFDVIQRLGPMSKARKASGQRRLGDVGTAELSNRAVLSEFSDHLLLFEEAAACDSYVPSRQWEDGLLLLASDLAEFKHVARLAMARARSSLDSGDYAAAFEDARRIAKLSALVRTERHAIAHMVASAYEIIVAKLLLESAPKFKSEAHWDTAQELMEALLPTPTVIDYFVGDMVMHFETLRYLCEGGPQAQVFLDAARSEDSASKATPLKDADSRAIEAEALIVWTQFFKSASNDVTAVAENEAHYQKVYEKLVEWTLFRGLPPEFARVVEQLDGVPSEFEGRFMLAVQRDMYNKALSLAKSGKSAWPQSGASVESAVGRETIYKFQLTTNGFLLSCDHFGDGPVTVYFPAKP